MPNYADGAVKVISDARDMNGSRDAVLTAQMLAALTFAVLDLAEAVRTTLDPSEAT